MTVVVSMKDVGPSRKQLTIEVPGSVVEEETKKVTREFGRQVRLPGFRPGKVPPGVVRKRFAQQIDKEVADRLLPRYWFQAKEEKALEPLLPPEVDEVGEIVPGEPLTFTATVDVRPEIELGELGEFDLPEAPVEPSDEEVGEVLDGLRREVADWRPVERAAARGDLVRARITELTDGDEETEPEPDSLEVEVGDPNVWEELSLALTGLGADQSARFSHRPPSAGGGDQPAPERHFEVEVQEVKEKDLPELDDAFAQKVGDFETVDALRERVVENLRARKKGERRDEREKALMEQLRQRYRVDLPRGVVDHEVEHLVNDYASNLAQRGVDVENVDIDWRQVATEARPEAEKRVHNRLILDAIAEREGLDLSAEEFEEGLAAVARMQEASVPQVRRAMDEAGRLEGFRRQLRRNKVIRRLLGEETEEPDSASEVAESSTTP